MKPVAHRLDCVAKTANRDAEKFAHQSIELAQRARDETPANGCYSLELLQHISTLDKRSRDCSDAAQYSVLRFRRARMRTYQHRQLVAVCNTKTRTPVLTLAQLSAQHIDLIRTDSNTPPGQLVALSPIATCAASNAPGLERQAHTQEVTATT